MNLSNLFTSELPLPLGRTIFLAWLTASLLHIQWGISVSIRDVSPVEFVLQAGLLFGYFVTFMAAGYIVAVLIMLIVSVIALRIVAKHSLDPVITLQQDPIWQKFQTRFARILANLVHVIAMFIAFLFYSESMLSLLAPIGLVIALILFVVGQFD